MYSFTISGRTPSKKNARILTARNGRMMSFPSDDYKAWQKAGAWEVKSQMVKQGLINPIQWCEVEIYIYPPLRGKLNRGLRPGDLTNKAESVMDLLVDCGVLKDDNWNVVRNVRINLGGFLQDDPKAIAQIIPLK